MALACIGLSGCATASSAAVHTPTLVASSAVVRSALPEQGRAIFTGQVAITDFIACQTCHPINPRSPNGAGPNLAGVALRAGARVVGQDAHEYLRHSIRIHDEFVVPGFAPGIPKAMVGREFGEILSDEQVEQLVAFLLTLDQPQVAARPGVQSPEAGSPTPSVSATVHTSPTPSPSVSVTVAATSTPLPASSSTAAPSPSASATVAATSTPLPVIPPTAAPNPSASLPAAAPTPNIAPSEAATPTPVPTAEELPSAVDDPDLARYAPCVACHNQHPNQVKMPHPLNPTCNTCHRGAPSRIGCPSCHSMHSIDNKHDATPDLACATCHT